jgi:hypothetical protein
MDTDRILAIAREAKALAGKVTGRYKFVPEASAPAIHCDGDRIAIGDIWTVPYRQDCGDPECDCHEIWERRDAQFKLFAHAGTHYATLAEAVERMGERLNALDAMLDVYNKANRSDPSFAAQGQAMDGYTELANYRGILSKLQETPS